MTTDKQLAPTDAELTECYKAANGEDVGKAQPLATQRIFRAMRASIAKWGSPAHSGEPYGCVTTHRGTGQQFFYRYPAPPYLDNASECVTVYTAPQPQVGEVESAEFDQFLSDVLTAAGLVVHGKQCKALGERLADMCMKLRIHGIKGGQHG